MKQTLILDSSQIDHFLQCPLMWEYGDVALLAPAGISERDSMDMGTFGHKLLELYYRGIAKGLTSEKAYKEASEIGTSMNPADIKLSQDRKKDVLLKFQWYWLTYGIKGHDLVPIMKNEKPLVELGFSYPLLDTPEYLFVLEGLIDMLAFMDGMKVFVDHKFQERRRALYKKSIQFKNYAMVSNSNLGCINYVRVTDKMDATTFERSMMTFSPQFLRLWKEELIEVYIQIAKAVVHHKREQRWSSCGGKFGYACNFAPVCEEFHPTIKQAILDTKYIKVQKWEPWKSTESLLEVEV